MYSLGCRLLGSEPFGWLRPTGLNLSTIKCLSTAWLRQKLKVEMGLDF